MENALSSSELELINQFDKQLLSVLSKDLESFRDRKQEYVADYYSFAIFDNDLKESLKSEIQKLRNLDLSTAKLLGAI
ncbi:hypothetical protein [Pseudopedobacter beijingensis]|uniref:Uncharacterized protein n=1 Tax=Pseudopedobacter beijingensis TaxID=1207056 RepID=A0ABW4IEZ5_9SPHI